MTAASCCQHVVQLSLDVGADVGVDAGVGVALEGSDVAFP